MKPSSLLSQLILEKLHPPLISKFGTCLCGPSYIPQAWEKQGSKYDSCQQWFSFPRTSPLFCFSPKEPECLTVLYSKRFYLKVPGSNLASAGWCSKKCEANLDIPSHKIYISSHLECLLSGKNGMKTFYIINHITWVVKTWLCNVVF